MLVTRFEKPGRNGQRLARFYNGKFDQAGSVFGNRAGVLKTGSHVIGCSGQREKGEVVESRAWGKGEASVCLL